MRAVIEPSLERVVRVALPRLTAVFVLPYCYLRLLCDDCIRHGRRGGDQGSSLSARRRKTLAGVRNQPDLDATGPRRLRLALR